MSNTQHEHAPDHESDPAHTPGDGWAGEGGASHLGPATHLESGHSHAPDGDAHPDCEVCAAEAQG